MSYAELLDQCRRTAVFLRRKQLAARTIVGIMTGDRALIIPAMAGIMNAGAVVVPLDGELPDQRLEAMIRDMGLEHVISSRQDRLPAALERCGVKHYFHEDILAAVTPGEAAGYVCPEQDEDESLYIYFTSGSTGTPKGIVGRNISLLQFLEWEIREFRIDEHTRVSQLISPYFDAYLRDIFIALLAGGTICIPPAEEDIFSPEKLTAWIQDSRINLIHCVPSVFRVINNGALAPGMFPDLKLVLLSGEKIIPSELTSWYSTMGDRIQLVNFYGATESTMIRSFYRIRPGDAGLPKIPIGVPIDDTELLIARKDLKPCNTLVPGDLYIVSKYVSKGYLNAPELTAERFLPFETEKLGKVTAFRTGDKGRKLPDGSIELLGREDRQVKIRGVRVELDEIEAILHRSGLLRQAAVVAQTDEKENVSLTAFVIAAEEAVPEKALKEDIFHYLQAFLPPYMLPSDVFVMSEFPLLGNGKINYKALPALVKTERELVAPANPTEEGILAIWKGILGDKPISVEDSFHHIGGNSLTIMSLIAKIHAAFNVRISLSDLFRHTTVRRQAEFVQNASQEKAAAIPKAGMMDGHPLSFPQRRLYFLYEMDNRSLAYNMPQAIRLGGTIDIDRLNEAFRRLIARHASLRTYFEVVNGEPVQYIADWPEFEVQLIDANGREPRELVKEFVRPFNLHKAPLIRAGLIDLSSADHVLVVDVHHIVSDGMSQNLLIRDFMGLYSNIELPLLPLDYVDFATWQRDGSRQVSMARQREFWINEFSGELPVLELPTDFARPSIKSYEGGMIPFELDAETTAALRGMAEREDVTLFMVILSLFGVLLNKLSHQRDIILCTPIAGRHHEGLENIVGMFAGTLPLRLSLHDDMRFRDILQHVKLKTLACFDNQDYPYEELIDDLKVERDNSRNPLFDVMLAFENFHRWDMELPGLTHQPLDMDHSVSKFDLTMFGTEMDGRIVMNFEYAVKLFKETTIRRLADYFKKIVSTVISDGEMLLGNIDIIPDGERSRLLHAFNRTEREYDREETIHGIFEQEVNKHPDMPAVVFEDSVLTYGELNARGNQLARRIGQVTGGHKGFVGVLIRRSDKLMAAIIGILKSGNAYVPIDPEYPAERIAYIVENSRLSAVVSEAALKEVYSGLPVHIPVIDVADTRLLTEDRTNLPEQTTSSALAYLIYTSGSTGKPKGVMIEHRNVVNFMHGMCDRIPLSGGDIMLCLASISFDMSVGETLLPLMSGLTMVMASAVAQKDIDQLIRSILYNKVNILHISPSHMKLILSHPDGRTAMEGVKALMVGAEPFPPELLKEIKASYEGRIFNMYGPTETTVWSTIYECTHSDHILIGRPIANTTIRILDHRQRLQPIGITGELYIGGDGVARGYWENGELTEKKFIGDPTGQGGKVYRTGDLARWLDDGNIVFLGRIDNQVKIRGFRIELGEIESQLVAYEPIQEAVVLAREKDGEKQLVAYYVAGQEIESSVLRELLSRRLPSYMLPMYYVYLERFPRNPNGKLDRKALPEPAASTGGGYVAPVTETEHKLLDIWAEVLKMDKALIGVKSNFFELGGHSLKAILLVNKINRAFQTEVPLKMIFQHKDIYSLGRYLSSSATSRFTAIERAVDKPFYPLSEAQRAVYFLYELDRSSLHFNMPLVVRLNGALDKARLSDAIDALVRRHEVFRTVFDTVDGVPVQRIQDPPESLLEYFQTQESEPRQAIENFIRPFDLKSDCLLRVGLFETPSEYFLIIDTHHIIVDGLSYRLLVKELAALYLGLELPPLSLQYRDFAEWQQGSQHQKELIRQKGFWLNEFAEEIPVLELPEDEASPDPSDHAGGYTDVEISRADTVQLRAMSEPEGVSMFMILLSLYTILLGKLTDGEDITVETLVAGREHADVEEMLGMFVADLPLRNYPRGSLSFRQFLANVKAKALSCFENQSYPFKAPTHERKAFFIYEVSGKEEPLDIPGLSIGTYDSGGMVELRYDITLIAKEEEGIIKLRLCCAKKTSRRMREKFAVYLSQIIGSVVKDPQVKLGDIRIMTDSERDRILQDFNNTEAPLDKAATFAGLFRAQVEKSPDEAAVVHDDRSLTYSELSTAAGRLAAILRANGIGPGKKVALYMPRSIEFLTAILSVFEAGGAYIPLDVHYPRERVREILADSEPQVVLTIQSTIPELDAFRRQLPDHVKCISVDHLEDTGLLTPAAAAVPQPDDLAYIIYTSGSTGKPKGVMIHHLGMINHLLAKIHDLGLKGGDVIAQTASPCFDISVWQFLAALISGGTTCILDRDVVLDPGVLLHRLRRHGVTVFESVPSLMTAFLNGLPKGDDHSLPELRWMIATGERLGINLVRMWYALYPQIKLLNAYGPTEASDDVTHHIVEAPGAGQHLVSIGKPVRNTHIYILDRNGNLCPIGMKGEICVGGTGVGKGYWKNEELTRKVFRPNPLLPYIRQKEYDTIYRTGDIGYYLDNGDIICLGRTDDQVKVRGFRLEPGEVEHVLIECEGVKEAVLLAAGGQENDRRLLAFIVPENPSLNISHLRRTLKDRVPDHMVPSVIVKIDKIPLTSNGKADRNALLKKGMALYQAEENYVAPRTEVEKQLAEIWEDVLGMDMIGMNETFFDLGGHSLLIIRCNQRVKNTFDVDLPFRLYFDHTLEQMAEEIGRLREERPASVLQASSTLLTIIIAILCCLSMVGRAVAQSAFSSNGRMVNVDAFNKEVEHMMDDIGIPGMSLAVIDSGRIVYFHPYGIRRVGDKEKVAKETVFDGCSLSKSFLAFVAYQLADEKKLDLDKPMYEYLPDEQLEYDPRYKRITSRMVLSHSSGLENWIDEHNPDTLEILYDPGTEFVYSGEGYQYLSKVIEVILHQTYEEYVTQRVLKPLGLKHTFLKYTDEMPDNYATGHETFGNQRVFKNTGTFPAAGVHFTAEDYATLILSLFDGKHLSEDRVKDILTPLIRVENSSLFYGPGFEVIKDDRDIIIAHGGNKPGYKNQMFYSVKKKRGFVFMTNSDRGKSMISRLCELTAGLSIQRFLQSPFYNFDEYPSLSLSLLREYDKHGKEGMLARRKQLTNAGKMDFHGQIMLVNHFRYGGESEMAKLLLKDDISLYPDSSLCYVMLADLYLGMDSARQAYDNYMKGQELHFSAWKTDRDIATCQRLFAEAERRKQLLAVIGKDEQSTVRAEDYNTMRGVQVEKTLDTGGGHNVGFIDATDWMDYKVNVVNGGTFMATFRVASMEGGGKLEFYSDDKLLTTINIAATKGWQNWTSVTAPIQLSAGIQTLRIYATTGGFNVNWIKFSSSWTSHTTR